MPRRRPAHHAASVQDTGGRGRRGRRAAGPLRRAVAVGLSWAFAGPLAGVLLLAGGAPRFYDDDPLAVEVESQDASGVTPREVVDLHERIRSLLAGPDDGGGDGPARSTNTVDEVPDSSWYTNRLGARPLSTAEIARGPNRDEGPADGVWWVTSGKNDGVTPGFTIEDARGVRWLLKFDPPGHEGMASSAEIISTKLLWALGYHVPENHLVRLRPDRLAVREGATVRPFGARTRRMRPGDILEILRGAPHDADGTYRVLASRVLDGTPLGGFRFHGTRPDDPNDVVPHEDRRELRALRVFSAWINHTEIRASNTLDTLVVEGGLARVRHHLIDFGGTLGSATTGPRPRWLGYEYLWDGNRAWRSMLSFGLQAPPWSGVSFVEGPVIGRLEENGRAFDPEAWKPRIPNPAFARARADDTFWAARKLAAMSDALIRAAVGAAGVPDAAAEMRLVETLRQRRDAILRRYLPAVNPVVDPRIEDGALVFGNAAVEAGVAAAPPRYAAVWWTFDNATGSTTPLGETAGDGPRLAAPALPSAHRSYVRADVRAVGGPASWARPVHVYFRREGSTWRLVGFERLPDDVPGRS